MSDSAETRAARLFTRSEGRPLLTRGDYLRLIASEIREAEAEASEQAEMAEHDLWTRALHEAGLYYGDEAGTPQYVASCIYKVMENAAAQREKVERERVLRLYDEYGRHGIGCLTGVSTSCTCHNARLRSAIASGRTTLEGE